MKYTVKEPFTVKTSQGEQVLQAEQVIILPHEAAIRLLNEGRITPESAYEERAGIMQFDGGLDRAEAERQAWCFSVCMLYAKQKELCERVKPCPKLTVNLHEGKRDAKT